MRKLLEESFALHLSPQEFLQRQVRRHRATWSKHLLSISEAKFLIHEALLFELLENIITVYLTPLVPILETVLLCDGLNQNFDAVTAGV